MVGNKEIAKQDFHVKQEDDTLSIRESEYGTEQDKQKDNDALNICGLEDGEILTDREDEEKEEKEESKKIIFKRIWKILGESQEKPHSNLLHLMFTHAAITLSIQGKWKHSVWGLR